MKHPLFFLVGGFFFFLGFFSIHLKSEDFSFSLLSYPETQYATILILFFVFSLSFLLPAFALFLHTFFPLPQKTFLAFVLLFLSWTAFASFLTLCDGTCACSPLFNPPKGHLNIGDILYELFIRMGFLLSLPSFLGLYFIFFAQEKKKK